MKSPYSSSCHRCRDVSNMGLMNVLRIICPVLMLWAGCLPSATGQSLELLELPNITEKELVSLPKNLARWHMDVTVTYIDENGRQEQVSINNSEESGIGVLLSDDETLAYNFKKGAHSLIINLLNPYPINRLFLMSYSASGSVDIAVSDIPLPLGSRRWVKTGENIPVNARQRTDFTFPIILARFVQLNFNIEKAGEIASLGLFGGPNISQTKFQEEKSDSELEAIAASEESYSYDYASLYTGTEIAYLNSGPLINANLMIDDDALTYYEFSPEDDQSILVLDLKREAIVNKVSILYETGPGRLEFYILSSLKGIFEDLSGASSQSFEMDGQKSPDTRNLPTLANFLQQVNIFGGASRLNKVRLPESFFEDHKPIVIHEVKTDEERFRVDFDQLSGRYLLIRWIPSSSGSGNKAADDIFATTGIGPREGLKIYEISLFGDIPASQAILNYPLLASLFGTPASDTDTTVFTQSPVQTTPQIPPASP